METERNNEQPKWAIYVRGHDLEALTDREARCRRVADQILALTTPPVAVWTDIETDWEGRDAMLQAASEEGFSTLLTTAPDRISRDLAQYRDVTETLNARGVDVIFADLIAEASQQPDEPAAGIVDRYLLDKLQKWMGRRRNRHLLNSALRCETCAFMLSGLLTCGKCGRPMAGATARSGRFYRCIGAYTRTGAPAACDAPSVSADRLERAVWSHVEEIIRESAGATGDSDEKRKLAERCQLIIPRLDGLDRRGKRRVLVDLRVRAKALFLPDGVWDGAELQFPNEEDPEPTG